MSIIDPGSQGPIDPITPPTGDPTSPPSLFSDDQIAAMLEGLRGALADMMTAAITEAQASMPMITVNSGTVSVVTINNGQANAGTATCKMDGDDTGGTIIASIICDRPNPGDRVMVLSTPAATAYVIGIPGGTGVPAGVMYAYLGDVTADTIGANGIPRGHLRPYGQVVEQGDAPWLYAAQSTKYNTGGETATQFRMADMRGRIPIGLDNMGGSDAGISSLANSVGTAGGAETHSISTGNLPFTTPSGSVSISGTVSGSTGTTSNGHQHASPDGSSFITASGGAVIPGTGIYTANNSAGVYTQGQSADHNHGFSGSLSGSGSFSGNSFGSGTPVNHLPPVRVVNWLVVL